MANNSRDVYREMDEKYGDQLHKLFGLTSMGFPTGADAARLNMLTQEIKQHLSLENPDVARLQTGFERSYGKLNHSYRKLEGRWEVKDIINKFNNIGISKELSIYMLVLYNPDTDTYDMIEKKITNEDLPEKYTYSYNTERMDSLEIGDILEDEVIYKSKSYDKNMNYCYGKNAKVFLSTSTDTMEDALKIRQGWAEQILTSEADSIWVSINQNHIPINSYGDMDTYKPIPDIGEYIQNSQAIALRPINKAHIYTDFQTDKLNSGELNSTDIVYNASDNSIIYDINIYYNNPEPFPDNTFFHQLKGYYDSICDYADRILEWTTKIKNSGSNYTKKVTQFRSDYLNFNNPEYTWKSKDGKAFGNMVVELKVKGFVGLEPGSKLSGRYGDKGVIAKITTDEKVASEFIELTDSLLDMLGREINEEERMALAKNIEFVPDDEMPYTDEFPIDIIANASGAVRRLNTDQIYEVDLTFAASHIQKAVIAAETMEEKEDLIFGFLSIINQDQCDFFYNMYKSFDNYVKLDKYNIVFVDNVQKEAFIKDVEENGFYIIKPPHAQIRYETMKKVYDTYPFIKPYPMYIDIFGTKRRRIIKDGVIGDKYIMILKHNSNKNFSARSTYRVNRANLPSKDTSKRENRSAYSHNPIRIGEAYNLMASISGKLLAEYNIFMRSSVMGRNELGKILEAEDNPLAIKRLEVKDNFINANADIFAAKAKTLGFRLEFVRDYDRNQDIIEDVIMPLHIHGYTIYDTPLRRPIYNKLFEVYEEFLSTFSIVESYRGEKNDLAWQYVFAQPEVKELDITDEMKEMLTGLNKEDYEKLINENSSSTSENDDIELDDNDSETEDVNDTDENDEDASVEPEIDDEDEDDMN